MTPVLTEIIENQIIPAIKKAGRAKTNDVDLVTYIVENHADEFDVCITGTHDFEITFIEPTPIWAKALMEVFGDDDDETTSEYHCCGCGCHCDETEELTIDEKLDEINEKIDHLVDMFDLICTLMYVKDVLEE